MGVLSVNSENHARNAIIILIKHHNYEEQNIFINFYCSTRFRIM